MKKQYSLWIYPPKEIRDKVQKIISELSQKFNTPDFEPHVTLLERFDEDEENVIEKTETLTSQIKPFQIDFTEISFSNTFFQSVFLRVKSSASLMDINLKAKKMFGIDDRFFMPHMSLTYGIFSMEEREKIVSQIEIPDNLSFMFDTIILKFNTSDPKEWKHLAEVKLG